MSELSEHFGRIKKSLDEIDEEVDAMEKDRHFENRPELFVKLFDVKKLVSDAKESIKQHIKQKGELK